MLAIVDELIQVVPSLAIPAPLNAELVEIVEVNTEAKPPGTT